MKKIILFSFVFSLFTSLLFSQVTIAPSQFNVTDQITITVSFASATCNTMGTSPAKVYMHAGIGDDSNAFGYSVVGNWGADDNVGLMTNNGNGTWSKTITPSTYFGINATQQLNATKMGMVFRNATGSQTLKKPTSCGDFIFNVGLFQVTMVSPLANSATILASGSSLNIQATNTNGVANYNLKSNGVSINTASNTSSYSYNHTNITVNQSYELEITQGIYTQIKKFAIILNPGTIFQTLPALVEDGINYNASDATKATLVLDAPFKDFVYVAGSFNNWQPGTSYAMKKDPTTGKFWLELTGLISGQNYSYQYWVVDTTPIANSPSIVKTADPYSTLVLSPYDDPYIPASTYPNMPVYPVGQDREVTVLRTGQAEYNWQVTTFNKPKKEDLIVYEVLIRDFDSDRNFQDLIDKIDYFKNLNINAIELMPVMEFEGNENWGYSTEFHMALDKFYGPAEKMKEFVDLCHQNGIAVILDIALNHAFGRNPMDRMWMNDPDGDGWGSPSSENPYFNVAAMHSFNVGYDFNHQQARTQYYTKRVVKQWIQKFKIDGFRWDLTKGFTQNCPSNVSGGQDNCTHSYQQDRIDVLKDYADYSWSLDPTHYTIFEHLGSDNEEQQWANYRINETPSKGVMMWGEMTNAYAQLIKGYATNADITRIGHVSHGFTNKRLLGYPESHDKERLIYSAMTFGVNSGTSPFNNLNNSLGRMSAIGASSILVPGPKMLWHFADLGMQNSIYTCTDGTINTESDPAAGDCKLATKPQMQWTDNWLAITQRNKIYSDWSKMIALKINEPVFEGDYAISIDGSNLKQRIYVYNNALPATDLKNVVVLCNFSVISSNINPSFPYIGTWYNLIDNTSINVTNVTTPITIAAGQFVVYGNKQTTLNSETFELSDSVTLYPNPASNYFSINTTTSKVQIYSITGQLVKIFENKPNDFKFDVYDLTKGIYLVKVIDEANHEKTMKLIKQ
jgi:glycosidase